MKKIFSIISASLSALVLMFILTLSFIKTNVPINIGNPVSIYVFNQSTAATVVNGYKQDNAEYSEILKRLKKVTSISNFKRLVNSDDVKPKVQQDLKGAFSVWSTELKVENIVIELVYDKQQDLVVYVGDDTRVISYFCLAYVIPVNKSFSEAVLYYATTNSDESKNKSYEECDPLYVKCTSKALTKYVNKI